MVDAVFGDFFGSDLTQHECDRILAAMPRKTQGAEGALFFLKWFDYRLLDPVIATYLFAHEWNLANARQWAVFIDVNEAKTRRAFQPQDFLTINAKRMREVWNARQAADSIGVTYPFFITQAIDYFMQERQWRQWSSAAMKWQLPQPQFWIQPECIEAIIARWADRNLQEVVLPKHEFYHLDNFREDPHQLACQRWIAGQVCRHPHVTTKLRSLMNEKRLVSQAIASERITDDIVLRALTA